MKILYVTSTYGKGIGGKENYVYEISQRIAEEHQVRVIARFNEPVDYFQSLKRFTACSNTITYMDGNVGVNTFGLHFFEKLLLLPVYKLHFNSNTQSLAIWMYDRVWNIRLLPFIEWADIVEFDGVGFELLGFSVALVCNKLAKPFIVLPHIHHKRWGDSLLDIKLYKMANGIITKTNYEKNLLASYGINDKKIYVVPSAPILNKNYDPDYFRKKYSINGNMILFVGRKIKSKGYNAMHSSTEIVWKEYPNTYFVFVGPGKPIIKNDKRIIELLPINGFEKSSSYACCDVFCMPSYEEAFGIVYTEAWAMGKPVIGGDIPVLREIICDGVDGLLVRQEPKSIADAIIKLLKDKNLREKMGKLGKEKVDRYFTWDKIITETENLYKQLLINKTKNSV
ncbi:MAG: glycosyltransferase family 4 protein [bacterium]|nr:glycosyltransferase family 4 protein [bacterium]